jgi:chromatin remodeling complex protein RSC6
MPQLEIIFSETTKKMLETLAEEFAKGKLSPEKSDKFAKTLVSRWHKYTEMKTLLKVKSGKTKEKEVKKTSMDFLKELRKKTGKKKKNDFKTLEKTVSREMKNAQKASSKKRRSNVNRKPSGFVKPTRISDELATFLGKDKGTEMARTNVTKEINAYIRAQNLQDPANRRHILPDAKLKKLLALKDKDELTYFNLQRFISHHFQKATPAV